VKTRIQEVATAYIVYKTMELEFRGEVFPKDYFTTYTRNGTIIADLRRRDRENTVTLTPEQALRLLAFRKFIEQREAYAI
jgi:hypothetical protein